MPWVVFRPFSSVIPGAFPPADSRGAFSVFQGGAFRSRHGKVTVSLAVLPAIHLSGSVESVPADQREGQLCRVLGH